MSPRRQVPASTHILASSMRAMLTLGVLALVAVGGSQAPEHSPSAQAATAASPPARVGAFYFDGWAAPESNFHFNGLIGTSHSGRRPLSGWRDDRKEAVEAQLLWARQYGLSFFVFDWYSDTTSDSTLLNNAHSVYKQLPDRHGMGYALAYVTHPPFGVSLDRWAAVADQWATSEFSDPDYVKIGGRPLLVMTDTHDARETWGGSAGVNQALEILQDAARRHGFPGVFVVGGRHMGWDWPCFPVCDFWDAGPSGFVTEHWSAFTSYSYPWIVEPRDGPRPYADADAGIRPAMDHFANTSPIPFLPSVMAGWDPRPIWESGEWGGPRTWFVRSPSEVASALRYAIDWLGRNPRMHLGPPSEAPLVLLESWNEIQEGGYVLPTDEYGFDYGRAIAEALGVSWIDAAKQTLSVTRSGKGVVRSTPPGIACPPTCSAPFGRGVEVALKGAAARGFLAPLWTGCRLEASSACTRVLVHSATVKARFGALAHAASVTLRIGGGQVAGTIRAAESYRPCFVGRQLRIERRVTGGWERVRSARADVRGVFTISAPTRPGAYRAFVPLRRIEGHTCLATASATIHVS